MKVFFEILFIAATIIVLIYLFFIFAKTVISPSIQQNPLSFICFREKCFSVEIAKTESERNRGLMFRTELDKDKGMLFIFDKEDIYPFWMKNALISLDIIWVDSHGKVVYISENAQPCKNLICPLIYPPVKAMYVLEVNAGICKEISLELGNELKININ